jgi:hypothetical protein
VERRSKSLSDSISPVRVFLDDLEEIYDVLSADAAGGVTIVTDDYILGSPDELDRYRGRVLKDVEIKAAEPYVSVHLRAQGAWIYSARDDSQSTGLFEKVRAVVRRCRPRYWWLMGANAPWVLGVIAGSSATPLALNADKPWSLLGIALGAVALVWLAAAYHFDVRAGAIVVPTRRSEAPSFLRRNSDRLIIAALSAAATALIAYFLPNRG